MGNRSFVRAIVAAALAALLLAGCDATATVTIVSTATPSSPCVTLVPGATAFNGVSGVSGLQVPAGTYISAATTTGGGVGQYTIASYMLCFQGAESAIDGGILTKSATPSSTLGYLVHGSWTANNLFPDPSNFSYLDSCSSGHTCVNDPGSPNPFTFVGVDQFASQSGGFTTFRLQVATIAAPTCLNDANYYSGTPQYALYEDNNSASSSDPTYHFQMPPGTRRSTYLGGGTAGSDYVYYCSAGTQASVVSALENAMQNDGYTISDQSASGFMGSYSKPPYTYGIMVDVQNTNNYYLRIFVPI
jgi:hypothetical protein